MTNAYCSLLIAILLASSACLAVESAQRQPSVAIITGEVQNPRSREIVLYEPLLLSHQRIILDSQNRFTLALPVGHGTLVIGGDEGEQQWVKLLRAFIFGYNPLIFFVEPGDSLHVVIEKGFFNSSYAFSGPNADNSRFMAEWSVPFDSFDLDFEDLQVENFSRQMDQWRREQFEFLAEGREQYALSLGCIDYVTASVNYDWVNRMIAYPRAYSLVNGHENKNIPPEFYDFLAEMPLVDEKAVGVGRYRVFLMKLPAEVERGIRSFQADQVIRKIRPVESGTVRGDRGPSRLGVRTPSIARVSREDRSIGSGFVRGSAGPVRCDTHRSPCSEEVEFCGKVRFHQAATGGEGALLVSVRKSDLCIQARKQRNLGGGSAQVGRFPSEQPVPGIH